MTFEHAKIGDKVKLARIGHHWFTSHIENAKKLDKSKVYTISKIQIASSWTGVCLEETGDLMYDLGWFDAVLAE